MAAMGSGASAADKNGIELYHQTDEGIADAIVKSQHMKPGTKGLAGAGIYFATTPELTGHKARGKGVILKAYVRLGKVLTLPEHGDTRMTLEKLRSMGFDSVCIARKVSSGHEYVVYDPSQVLHIEKYDDSTKTQPAKPAPKPPSRSRSHSPGPNPHIHKGGARWDRVAVGDVVEALIDSGYGNFVRGDRATCEKFFNDRYNCGDKTPHRGFWLRWHKPRKSAKSHHPVSTFKDWFKIVHKA